MLIFFSEKKVTLDLWSFFFKPIHSQIGTIYIYLLLLDWMYNVGDRQRQKRVVLIFYWPLIQFYDNCNPALKKLNCSIKSLEHS